MENVINKSSAAQKLKALRSNKNMSAGEVAKEVGISASALLMYETGKRTPRDSIKIKLANYYGQPIGELFYGQ